MKLTLGRWLVCALVAVFAAGPALSAAAAAHGQHAVHLHQGGLHEAHAGHAHPDGDAVTAHWDHNRDHTGHTHDQTLSPAGSGHSGCASHACCHVHGSCCVTLALLTDERTAPWPEIATAMPGARAMAIPAGQLTSPLLRPPRALA